MEITIGYCTVTYNWAEGTRTEEHHNTVIDTEDIVELHLLYDHSDDCVWVSVKMNDGRDLFGKESYHRENNIKDWEALPHTSSHTDGVNVW